MGEPDKKGKGNATAKTPHLKNRAGQKLLLSHDGAIVTYSSNSCGQALVNRSRASQQPTRAPVSLPLSSRWKERVQ